MTLSDLQAERDKLVKQLSAPAQVRNRDNAMQSRTVDEIQTAINRIDAEIAALTGGAPSRVFTVQTNRGI